MAPKLIASVYDLERITESDQADVPALKGWRREVFGEQAIALKNGRLALTVEGKKVKFINIHNVGKERNFSV